MTVTEGRWYQKQKELVMEAERMEKYNTYVLENRVVYGKNKKEALERYRAKFDNDYRTDGYLASLMFKTYTKSKKKEFDLFHQ